MTGVIMCKSIQTLMQQIPLWHLLYATGQGIRIVKKYNFCFVGHAVKHNMLVLLWLFSFGKMIMEEIYSRKQGLRQYLVECTFKLAWSNPTFPVKKKKKKNLLWLNSHENQASFLGPCHFLKLWDFVGSQGGNTSWILFFYPNCTFQPLSTWDHHIDPMKLSIFLQKMLYFSLWNYKMLLCFIMEIWTFLY